MNIRFVKGILYVALGAASYGVLATFVKLGRIEGFTTGELTFSQSFIGLLILSIIYFISTKTKPSTTIKPNRQDKVKLMLGGISMGLTSTFYYLSLNYISVSVAIILLMQSVWMGSVIDIFVYKTLPSKNKLLAIAIVLIGTLLATDLLNSEVTLDWIGILWGMLAALSYTMTLFASNNIATRLSPLTRSFYLMCGAFITVSLIWGYSLSNQFDWNVLWKWGVILALFGMILPPLLFTKGMPVTGVGLGSIIASVELPVSVMMAYTLLGEKINGVQWTGILLILLAVFLMNYSLLKIKSGK